MLVFVCEMHSLWDAFRKQNVMGQFLSHPGRSMACAVASEDLGAK